MPREYEDESSSLSDADLEEELAEMDADDDEALPSSDEDNYKIEDPDEIDDDLELHEEDEEDEFKGPKKLTLKLSPQKQLPNKNKRRRQDDIDDGDQRKARLQRRVQPTDLDEDLILTDEETEYNPHANPDISKMTERQRARYLEDQEEKDGLVELSNEKKSKPKKKESDEVIALRKAESARRREDYKNKQLEEEKKDTLNKLLKRRATKTRQAQPGDGEVVVTKAHKDRRPYREHAGLLRYVNKDEVSLLAFN